VPESASQVAAFPSALHLALSAALARWIFSPGSYFGAGPRGGQWMHPAAVVLPEEAILSAAAFVGLRARRYGAQLWFFQKFLFR